MNSSCLQPRTLLLASIFSGLLVLPLAALEPNTAPPIDPRMHADDDAYFSRQAKALLAEVNETLAKNPPQHPEPRERRLGLLLMDGVLHEQYAPARPPVQEFYHQQIEAAIVEMETAKVESGARIWKLYNHGFVVRTATVTLAFDLNPGPEAFRVNVPEGRPTRGDCAGFPIAPEWRERLAKQCDVLFISHRHADHANESMATLFLDQQKPVVAPVDVFEGGPLQERITHLPREIDIMQELPIQEGGQTLKLVVYPGQQYQGKGTLNNVVLVFTPDGISFAHNGDQINDPYPEYQEDFKWIDKVHEAHPVDVLMTNCWTNDLLRIVKGFAPKLVLPGHENELSHPLWDRVPYWGDAEYLNLNYPQVKEEFPTVVMTWGESYQYTPGK